MDDRQFKSIVHDDSFINVERCRPDLYQTLVQQADDQAVRTIALRQLPKPLSKTAWQRSIDNDVEETRLHHALQTPITVNAGAAITPVMPNQAEMVSCLESIYRTRCGLVPVTSVIDRHPHNHRTPEALIRIDISNDPNRPAPVLEMTNLAEDPPYETIRITPMLVATGSYPDDIKIFLSHDTTSPPTSWPTSSSAATAPTSPRSTANRRPHHALPMIAQPLAADMKARARQLVEDSKPAAAAV